MTRLIIRSFFIGNRPLVTVFTSTLVSVLILSQVFSTLMWCWHGQLDIYGSGLVGIWWYHAVGLGVGFEEAQGLIVEYVALPDWGHRDISFNRGYYLTLPWWCIVLVTIPIIVGLWRWTRPKAKGGAFPVEVNKPTSAGETP